MHSNRRASGFTLVELMITIVVIGVLMAIALPQLGYLVNRDRDNRTIDNLDRVLAAGTHYAFQHDGCYPDEIGQLQKLIPASAKNLFTGQPVTIVFRKDVPSDQDRLDPGTIVIVRPAVPMQQRPQPGPFVPQFSVYGIGHDGLALADFRTSGR